MQWTIGEVARLTGITTRTLRHYGHLGLLAPSTIDSNGRRWYDEDGLTRLQEILVWKELGFSLARISQILEGQVDEQVALARQLDALASQRRRVDQQIAAVKHALDVKEGREMLMAKKLFTGFNHAEHKKEVEERWGTEAYQRSSRWWNELEETEKQDWTAEVSELNDAWIVAAQDEDLNPEDPVAQELAHRHVTWLRRVPGTPAADPGADWAQYVLALAQMYVEDERFAANYGGTQGAEFVRDALSAYINALQ